jgi:hypothetical protein
MLRRGSWFAPLPWCNITLLFDRQWTVAFGMNFGKAQKTATRRLPELAPELPSTAMSLHEKESREADAQTHRAAEAREARRKGGLLARRHGESSAARNLCSVRADLFCPRSAHWPFPGPHKTAWIDPPGYSQVSVKQRKWVGWKTGVDNAKSAGAKRPVGVRFPSRHRPGSWEKSPVRFNIRSATMEFSFTNSHAMS